MVEHAWAVSNVWTAQGQTGLCERTFPQKQIKRKRNTEQETPSN